MNSLGILTYGGFAAAGMGRTSSGVIRTISSELLRVTERLWNNLPNKGMLARPGTLLMVSVRLLSSRPAITKLCPLSSSTSVCTLRVASAGIV